MTDVSFSSSSTTLDTTRLHTRPRGFSRAAMATATTSATADSHQERIRQILADRSTLRLSHVHLMPRDQWVKKELRPHCVFCERKFRAFSRKLHCRACGEVVCSSCNRKRDIQVGASPSDTLPVRLCLDCIDRALSPADDLEATDSPTATATQASTDEASCVTTAATTSSRSATEETSSGVCSPLVRVADGLLRSFKSVASGSTITDSLAQLELSMLQDDSDNESSCPRENGYDSDGASIASETGSDFKYDNDHDHDHDYGSATCNSERMRRLSSTKFYGDTPCSALSNSAASTASSSGSRTLGFVPEDSNLGDFAGELEIAIDALDGVRRAELLKQYNVASLDRQREFDAICQLVSRALNCGVAGVGFMGETSQWYKSKIGISQSQLPRNVAFCSQLLQSKSATIVMDATRDKRFYRNPLVTGSARIRFYASTPVCDPETRLVLGSVFVMDPQPKTQLPARAMEVLAYASSAVERLLQLSQKDQQRRRTRQKRMRRVFSAPTLVGLAPGDSEDDDGGEEYCGGGATDQRGGSLWTSEEPEPSRRREGKSSGVTLLDSDYLIHSRKSFSMRSGSGSRECETETAKVFGQRLSSSQRKSSQPSAPLPPSPGLCQELLDQIETTQQMLSSLSHGPARRKSSSISCSSRDSSSSRRSSRSGSSGGVHRQPPMRATAEVEV